MYRFVLSARWIGLGLLMTLAAAVMVGLGFWQLARYNYRVAINNRIDAATAAAPVPVRSVLTAPSPVRPGVVGPDAPDGAAWTRVSVTGRYDPAHEILARARTVNDQIGYEIVTPLVLADGTAVLVDRGWLDTAPDGESPPAIPAVPSGQVTVLGRIHAAESRPDQPEQVDHRVSVRRINPPTLAADLPYPIFGAYVTLDGQSPAADPSFVPVAPDHENSTMNAGYVAQWWAFAVMTLVGYGYLVRKEAQVRAGGDQPLDRAAEPGLRAGEPPLDRVAAAVDRVSDLPADTGQPTGSGRATSGITA